MSIWLFDLGNTRLKCAPLRADGRIGDAIAVAHEEGMLADAWEQALPVRFDAAYVASVAATPLRVRLIDTLARRAPRISLARTSPRFGAVRVAYPQAHTFGVDRFLALLGARALGKGAWLVVGVGTALTIDLLDADGQHRGGRIAASPTLMREALHARAAQLPLDGGVGDGFADNTRDALASGCDGAALGLIERSRAAAHAQLGMPPQVLLHGGGAGALLPMLPGARHVPLLVLEGLAEWARAAERPVQ